MSEAKVQTGKILSWLYRDWKLKLIVLAGLLGMLLILIGQLIPDKNSGKREIPQDTLNAVYTDSEQYAAELETKLCELIGNIDGVGRAQVMVTLEHGEEYVYAQEEKSRLDKTSSQSNGESAIQVDYKHDVESSYVFVDSGYGEKQPLIKTKLPPKVQGVVIVCEGADDIRVQESLTHVVTTALNIPTTRVCVVKINPN